MPEWLGENPIVTVVICLAILGIMVLLGISLFKKNKKSGGCGCGCASCPMKDGCKSNQAK